MARISEVSEVPNQGAATRKRPPERESAVGTLRHLARSTILSGRRWRFAVRWLGLAIFILGAVLLGYVFWEAMRGFQRFAQPDYLAQQLAKVAGRDPVVQLQLAIVSFGSELLRVLYLLLLGFLASVIAAKGIQFFAASEAIIDEAVVAAADDEDVAEV